MLLQAVTDAIANFGSLLDRDQDLRALVDQRSQQLFGHFESETGLDGLA